MLNKQQKSIAKELNIPIRWGGAWDISFTDTDDPTEDLVSDYIARRRRGGKKAFIDGPHYELPKSQYSSVRGQSSNKTFFYYILFCHDVGIYSFVKDIFPSC